MQVPAIPFCKGETLTDKIELESKDSGSPNDNSPNVLDIESHKEEDNNPQEGYDHVKNEEKKDVKVVT